jgi:hypothetical protein
MHFSRRSTGGLLGKIFYSTQRSPKLVDPTKPSFDKKWKSRWDEVQERIKDNQTLNDQFELNQTQFSWFPGHMYKASKQMEEILVQPDISLVLEIRDSRVRFLHPTDFHKASF